jgi:hypothetical protein
MGGGTSRDSPQASKSKPVQNRSYENSKADQSKELDGFWRVLRYFRNDSVEVTNDPRIFLDNIISKRLSAFEVVAVSSVLIASVSCTTLIQAEEPRRGYVEFVGLFLMCIVFVMNLFCVLVITQQYYQIFRLMTGGPTGFEIAKSYYLNENIMAFRHLATRFFFWSIPLFIVAVGIMVARKLEISAIEYSTKLHLNVHESEFNFRYKEYAVQFHNPIAIAILFFTLTWALLLFCVNLKHKSIFASKYHTAKMHEKQVLKDKTIEVHDRNQNAVDPW